jgi:hypothetical protein
MRRSLIRNLNVFQLLKKSVEIYHRNKWSWSVKLRSLVFAPTTRPHDSTQNRLIEYLICVVSSNAPKVNGGWLQGWQPNIVKLHCYGTSTDASIEAQNSGSQGSIWAVAPLEGLMEYQVMTALERITNVLAEQNLQNVRFKIRWCLDHWVSVKK